MQLIELVAEGVPGLPLQARFTLGAGTSTLEAASGLSALVGELLYPRKELPWALPATGNCRAALTLRMGDGSVLRVLRDFRRGMALQRQDEKGAFVAVPLTVRGDGKAIVAPDELPPRSLFLTFFASRRGAFTAPEGAVAVGVPAVREGDPRIAQLERELADAAEIETLQQRADALNQEVYAVSDRVARFDAAQARVEEARRAAAPFREARLPPDPMGVLAGYQGALKKKDEAEQRLDADETDAEERLMRFATGRSTGGELARIAPALVAGVAALAAGSLTRWPAIALGGIPAFTLAAWFAVQFIGRLQDRESAARKQKLVAERRRKITESWEEESQPLLRLLAELGLKQPEDLPKWLEAKGQAEARLAEAEQAFAAMEEDASTREAREAKLRLEREVEELEAEIARRAAGSFRPRQVIEQELAQLRGGGAGPAPGANADPTATLLDRASALLGQERQALLTTVAPRAAELLSQWSGGLWTELSWTNEGGASCAGSAGASEWAALEREDRDRLWAALRIAVVEAAIQRRPLPVIVDDGPEELAAPVAAALQSLAAHTQLVFGGAEGAGRSAG